MNTKCKKLLEQFTSSVNGWRLPRFCFKNPVKGRFRLITNICRNFGYIAVIPG